MKSVLEDIESWRIFAHLIQSGSISRSSVELGVEISKVSRTLTQLEKEIGEELLNRKARPLEPTEKGRKIYFRLLPILNSWNDFIFQLDNQPEQIRTIKLSTPAGIGRFYVNDLLFAYRKIQPRLCVDLQVEMLLQDVIEGRVDVAMIAGNFEDKRVLSFPCMNAFTLPLASVKYLQTHGMPKEPEDLKNHLGLLKSGENFEISSSLVKGNEKKILFWGATLKYEDMLNLKDALLKGFGISVDLPMGMILDELLRGEIVPVLNHWHRPYWVYSVIMRETDKVDPVIFNFAKWFAKNITETIDARRNQAFSFLGIDPNAL